MTSSSRLGLRRTTGSLFLIGALTFTIAASVLSAEFDWPDILREPAAVVLPAFSAGGARLVWVWFATAWTYALLAIPILLLPAALGRRDDVALRVATSVGAASVLLSLIGFLRWVFVVPSLGPMSRATPSRRLPWMRRGRRSTSSAERCWGSTWARCW